jgi:hypothetical protein
MTNDARHALNALCTSVVGFMSGHAIGGGIDRPNPDPELDADGWVSHPRPPRSIPIGQAIARREIRIC